MQKTISQIVVVGSETTFREEAIRALARTQVQIIFANDADAAVEEISQTHQLPGLVIGNLEYADRNDPLKLYHYMRGNPETCSTPFLHIVDTDFEVGLVKSMKLQNAFALRGPLTFASLVFALPALGLEIRDSILYRRKVSFDVENILT